MSVEILGYHHVTFLVRDIDRAAVFYDSVLNLRRKTRPPFSSRGIWYEVAGGYELHLVETDNVPPKNEGHPALEVRDIRGAVMACVEAGAILQQDVFTRTHDDSLSAFVRDPDGNLIEFTQHNNVK